MLGKYEKMVKAIEKNLWLNQENRIYMPEKKNWSLNEKLEKKLKDLQLIARRASPKAVSDRTINCRCPICARILNKTMNFCPECGQAIDWREE